MNTKNLPALKIHKLSQDQYDREVAAGRIDETAMYLTPDKELTAADVGARPDTWTPTAADVGAAPAGYGLGGPTTKSIWSVAGLDDVTENGWYNFHCINSYIGGFHLNHASVLVFNVDGDSGVWQEVRPLASTVLLRRAYHNGTWSNWVREMTSANFSYSDGTLTITI